MPYRVTKTYGHERGLSTCFRQWRASSHCRFLHGYALGFTLVFESDTLDARGWVIDFGALKWVKEFLDHSFDHRLAVAADDPDLDMICGLGGLDIGDPLVFEDGVGCEKFAEFVFKRVSQWLVTQGYSPRVSLISVEVREHGSNSATYMVVNK